MSAMLDIEASPVQTPKRRCRFESDVPRDPVENLKYRKWLIEWAKTPQRRAAVWAACRDDVLFYINSFVWQFNPRQQKSEIGPLVLWPFQDEAAIEILDAIEGQYDLFIEKSREMGASWLCLVTIEYLWHFRPWQKFTCMSRSEKAVEDDDPDSLFWKLDFIHSKMPSWLMPRVTRRKMFFGNDDNHSSITGEASTGRAGVGGRATAMFIDEFSQIKEDYEVLHRTSDTTGCRIFNGTHLGTDTAFFELSQRVDLKKLRMHWTSHPEKRKGLYRSARPVEVIDTTFDYQPDFQFVCDGAPAGGPHPGVRSPWYDDQCRRKGSQRAVAMDLDINPTGAVSQFFNPLVIRDLTLTYCRPAIWEGTIALEDNKPTIKEEVNGPFKMWCPLKTDGKPPVDWYAVGIDISTGTGATNSCISVASGTTGERVAEFVSPHTPPEVLAPIAIAICTFFAGHNGTPAKMCWETQGPGNVFGIHILRLGFTNYYFPLNELKINARRLRQGSPGWVPTDDAKIQLLSEYRTALNQRQFVNRCKLALAETLLFRYTPDGRSVIHSGQLNAQDPSGAGVNHGDRVIGDALAWKMIRPIYEQHVKGDQQESGEAKPGSLAHRRWLADNQDTDY